MHMHRHSSPPRVVSKCHGVCNYAGAYQGMPYMRGCNVGITLGVVEAAQCADTCTELAATHGYHGLHIRACTEGCRCEARDKMTTTTTPTEPIPEPTKDCEGMCQYARGFAGDDYWK